MTKVKTKSFELSRWQTDLFISLFNADGGDGFTDEEINEADIFIAENNLLSLVEVEDIGEQQFKCTFITDYGNPEITKL